MGENEACLVCLPVHRKDNMVSFESSLSQWQALLHCWSALDFFFFFSHVFYSGLRNTSNILSKFVFRPADMLQRAVGVAGFPSLLCWQDTKSE